MELDRLEELLPAIEQIEDELAFGDGDFERCLVDLRPARRVVYVSVPVQLHLVRQHELLRAQIDRTLLFPISARFGAFHCFTPIAPMHRVVKLFVIVI